MPHGGGGGSHGGGSHSSHSSHSSHRSGGGSHGGRSSHSSSHRSGGGPHSSSYRSHGGGGHYGGGSLGFRPRPHYRRRRSYFPGAYKYVYYRHHRPYYYYSDSPVAALAPNSVIMVIKMMFTIIVLFPVFAFCLMVFFEAANPPEKIMAAYDDSIVIEDQAGILEDTNELEAAMDAFLDKTGIAPAVITVNNEDWESYYYSLEQYAYELYVNHFSDEYHFLIVYSEPEEVDTAFNDWYWEYMAGDDTEDLLTDSECDDFTESLQSKLLANSRYTVDEAIATALTETSETCMKSNVGRNGVIGAVIVILVVVGIFWLMFFAGRGKKKAMNKATQIPAESEQLETKCAYCGGVYLRGTCTSCPHCGAPISVQ